MDDQGVQYLHYSMSLSCSGSLLPSHREHSFAYLIFRRHTVNCVFKLAFAVIVVLWTLSKASNPREHQMNSAGACCVAAGQTRELIPASVGQCSTLSYTLNIGSFTNPLHPTAIAGLADTQNIDVFVLTETWISPNTTSAQLFDTIPHGLTFINTPRLVHDLCTFSIVGGGTAFLLREPCKRLFTPTNTFKSFELSSVTLKLPHSNLALTSIVLLNLLRISACCVFHSVSRRLSDTHLICINFPS